MRFATLRTTIESCPCMITRPSPETVAPCSGTTHLAGLFLPRRLKAERNPASRFSSAGRQLPSGREGCMSAVPGYRPPANVSLAMEEEHIVMRHLRFLHNQSNSRYPG